MRTHRVACVSSAHKKCRNQKEWRDMVTRIWQITLDGNLYTIKVNHDQWTAERIIRVNRRLIMHEPPSAALDFGSRHTFFIGEHACLVRIVNDAGDFNFYLEIDERSAEEFVAPTD